MIREIDGPPLEGGLNTNYLIGPASDTNINRQLWPASGIGLLRIPRKNPDLLANIESEFMAIGFTGSGGTVRRRTSAEQYAFSKDAAQKGLRVLPPMETDRRKLVYPFLAKAQQLDIFFQSHPDRMEQTTMVLLADLFMAHRLGFRYGDRWAGNILVDPRFGIINIDFDIEISGPPSKELDLSQVIYHTIRSGGEGVITLMLNMLSPQWKFYDRVRVNEFLLGLSRFFKSTNVGGIQDSIEKFIEAGNILNSRSS